MTDNICGADMGEGVTCQRPLTEQNDPHGWRCGGGHHWWLAGMRDAEGREMRRHAVHVNGSPTEAYEDLPVPSPAQLHAAEALDEDAVDATETAYGLVMPFVCCSSKGGTYEDDSFVAGVQFGLLYERFKHHPPAELTETVFSQLVPQLDLVAMHHGYTLTVEDLPPVEGWTTVTFRLAPADERAA